MGNLQHFVDRVFHRPVMGRGKLVLSWAMSALEGEPAAEDARRGLERCRVKESNVRAGILKILQENTIVLFQKSNVSD